MPNIKNLKQHVLPSLWLWLGLLMLVLGLVVSIQSFGAEQVDSAQTVPYRINYQGRISDNQGSSLPDGDYNVRFRLYNTDSGGTSLWTEERTGANRVTVENGLFSVQLGEVTALPADTFTTYPLYLEIELPTPSTAITASPDWSEGPFTPRQRLASSPYAFNADQIDGYDSDELARLEENANFTGTNLQHNGDDVCTVAGNCSGVGGNGDVLQGGNAFGELMTLGTTDSNALRFITNNSEVMRLLTNGDVGIGTDTPGYRLDVQTVDAISASFSGRVIGADAVNSDEFVTKGQLDTAIGGVDAGVTSVNTLDGDLTLQGTAGKVTVGDDGVNTITLDLHADVSLLGQTIENSELVNDSLTVTAGTGLSGGGSVALGSSTTLDLDTSYLDSNYFKQGGNTFGAMAELGTTDAQDLSLISNGAEVMRLLTNGDVGIGTDTPGYRLDVQTTDAISASFSGRVIGADAVNSDEFATKGQLDTAIGGVNEGLFTEDSSGSPTFSYLTNTSSDLVLGADSIADASFYFDTASTNLYLGTDGVSNGVLTLYSGGTSINPATISINNDGDLNLSSGSGNVVVGSGNGDIELSLSGEDDSLIADKQVEISSSYSGSDFQFDRNLTNTTNTHSLGGAVMSVTDNSTLQSGTVTNYDLVFGNANPSGSSFSGNLLRLQSGGVDRFVVAADGTLTLASLDCTTFANGGKLTTNASGDVVCADATGGGVSSLNALDGDLTLQGVAGKVTVSDNGTDTITLDLHADVSLLGQSIQNSEVDEDLTISASGSVADGALSSNVTLQGNTFNGANQLVQLNASGQLPALDGSLLTDLNADNIASGTLADARLSSNVALLNRNSQTFTGNQQLFQNSTDSTTAFQVQDASGSALFNADTTNMRIGIGTDSPSYALDVVTADAISAQFSGRVIGADAVNNDEFVTLGQANTNYQAAGDYFVQGGNSFGATATLGTTDTQDLELVTDGTARLTLGSGGTATFSGDVVVTADQTLRLTGGTTASRPASPDEGTMWYDTDTDRLLVYSNGKWQADRAESVIVAASDSTQTEKDSADYVADGTDDQVEINAALTEATGGKVYLLPGTYVTHQSNDGDATIFIPNNTTLGGAGRGTLIQLSAGSSNDNLIENTDTSTGTNVVIRNLYLDGSLGAGGTQHGIALNSMGGGSGSTIRQGARLTDLWVENFQSDGIRLALSSHNTATNNLARGNGSVGFRVTLSNSNNTFTDNNSIANDGSGYSINNSLRSTVTGNTAEDNAGYGFYIDSSSNSVFEGNTVTNNDSTGFRLSGTSTSNTVTGNTVSDNNSYGFTIFSNHNTFTANTAENNDTLNFWLAFSATHNVLSNNISIGSTRGIQAQDTSTNNSYIGNSIHTASLYGIRVISGSGNSLISGNKLYNIGGSGDNNAIVVSDSDSNTIEGNIVSDSSATTTNYAINIENSTADNNYLANNTLGGGTINDAGTNTVYANQQDGNGTLVNRTADSTTAFQVQNASGSALLNADTTNMRIGVGTDTPSYALDVVTADAISAQFSGRVIGADAVNNDEFVTLGQANTNYQAAGDYFVQGGNSFGATATLGTTDTQDLRFITDNNEAIRIEAGGNVGIGTASPDNKLTVSGDMDVTGSFGVGTSNPQAVLHVDGDSLFRSDSATALRVQNAAGDTDILTVDSVGGKLTVGDTTHGVVLSANSPPQYHGDARPTESFTLTPEYEGMVLTPVGTSNTGTLTSDFCSASDRLNINTGVCSTSGDEHNYFSWTTTEGSAQDYDIYIRKQLPSNFDGFAGASAITMAGWRTTASDSVELSIFQENGSQCGSTVNVATSNGSWTEASLDATGCTFAADDMMLIRVRMTATNGNYARPGEIEFNYRSNF